MYLNLRNAAAGLCLSALSVSLSPAYAKDASTVQLYGLMDIGVQHISNGPKGNSRSGISAGNMNGSRWGMKGTDDLGGGLSSVFVLESGFEPNTGKSAQGGRLFGRQAYVGLADKAWGQFSLGRHNTLMIDWLSKYNPFENAGFGGKRIDAAFSDRMDNSAKYVGKFGPVSVGAYYSFGWNNEQSWTDKNTGRMIGGGLRYKSGPFDAALLYHGKRADAPKAGANSHNGEDRALLGLSYDFEAFKVYAGYRWLEQKLAQRDYTSHLYWLGASYSPSTPTRLSAVVYRMNGTTCDDMNVASCPAVQKAGSDQKPTLMVLGGEYDLSRRTTLYALGSYALNDNGSSVSVIGGKHGVNVEAGSNQFGLALGMRHRF